MATKRSASARSSRSDPPLALPAQVKAALAWMKAKSSAHDRANLARFGIAAKDALGVSVANLHVLAKQLGRNHALAEALWTTGCYEARMLAVFVDEPACVTPAQMERWCRDFDNWALCDTACFHLFDRTPHSFAMVAKWADRREEFVRRAAFALIAGSAAHDKTAADAPFLDCLPRIDQAADDARHLVKKGVSWALRGIGHRNAALHAAAVAWAERLATDDHPTRRWIGKDALRD